MGLFSCAAESGRVFLILFCYFGIGFVPVNPFTTIVCVCSVLNGWTKKAETVAGGGGESASICAPAAVFAVFAVVVHSASASANVQWTNLFFFCHF